MSSPRPAAIPDVIYQLEQIIKHLVRYGFVNPMQKKQYDKIIRGIKNKEISNNARFYLLDELLTALFKNIQTIENSEIKGIAEKHIGGAHSLLSSIKARQEEKAVEQSSATKINSEYMKALVAFAVVLIPLELANNDSTAESLDKLYSHPYFEEWIKTHTKEAKKLEKLEQDIANNMAEDLKNMCARIFSKPIDKEDKSPIDYVNRVSQYLAESILNCKSPQLRVRMMARWINVAKECVNKGDFHTFFAIHTGLTQQPIFRLKIDSQLNNNTREIFKQLSALMHNDKGFLDILNGVILARVEAAKKQDQIIPYWGLLKGMEARTEQVSEYHKQGPQYAKWVRDILIYQAVYKKIAAPKNTSHSLLQENITKLPLMHQCDLFLMYTPTSIYLASDNSHLYLYKTPDEKIVYYLKNDPQPKEIKIDDPPQDAEFISRQNNLIKYDNEKIANQIFEITKQRGHTHKDLLIERSWEIIPKQGRNLAVAGLLPAPVIVHSPATPVPKSKSPTPPSSPAPNSTTPTPPPSGRASRGSRE